MYQQKYHDHITSSECAQGNIVQWNENQWPSSLRHTWYKDYGGKPSLCCRKDRDAKYETAKHSYNVHHALRCENLLRTENVKDCLEGLFKKGSCPSF